MEEKYYITHLIFYTLPTEGLKKLFFYTKNSINNKYYFGKGNNSISLSIINLGIERGEVYKLPREIELRDKMGLWVSPSGNVYYGNLITPHASIPELLFKLIKNEKWTIV